LIAPALQGIYGASAEQLTAAAVFGRNGDRLPTGTRRRRLVAPINGMGELAERFAGWLKTRGVHFSFGRRVDAVDESVATLVCTSAPRAGPLVRPYAPKLGATLQSMPMTSLVTTTAFFPPHPGDIRGFGVLFPRGGAVDALGVLFNADIFAGRSRVRSETWISELLPSASDQEIGQRIRRDREILTGRSNEPIAVLTTRWPSALPTYGSAILEAESGLSELPPWLGLAGNYLGGIGLSKLLDIGRDSADRLCR
jgi:oxygen-dependent protoporphyrinogen oxidase